MPKKQINPASALDEITVPAAPVVQLSSPPLSIPLVTAEEAEVDYTHPAGTVFNTHIIFVTQDLEVENAPLSEVHRVTVQSEASLSKSKQNARRACRGQGLSVTNASSDGSPEGTEASYTFNLTALGKTLDELWTQPAEKREKPAKAAKEPKVKIVKTPKTPKAPKVTVIENTEPVAPPSFDDDEGEDEEDENEWDL